MRSNYKQQNRNCINRVSIFSKQVRNNMLLKIQGLKRFKNDPTKCYQTEFMDKIQHVKMCEMWPKQGSEGN